MSRLKIYYNRLNWLTTCYKFKHRNLNRLKFNFSKQGINFSISVLGNIRRTDKNVCLRRNYFGLFKDNALKCGLMSAILIITSVKEYFIGLNTPLVSYSVVQNFNVVGQTVFEIKVVM